MTCYARPDADRVRIFFDDIPPADLRSALKRHGWRWGPTARAWQRKATGNAVCSARQILQETCNA